jgi:hypothetical protein
MKIATASLILATSAVVWTGCVNPNGTPNNTGSGALIGGIFGAIAGSALGGRGPAGTLIGAAAGVTAGALIGNAVDQQQDADLRAEAPQTYVRVSQQQPLSIPDVKALIHAGISDDLIISQIGSTHSGFRLGSADIIDLRNSGASDKLINFMLSTANDPYAIVAGSPAVIVENAPPPQPADVVVGVAPGPDYVWVGGNWMWNGRWVWVPGHWGSPPRPHAEWVVAHWERGPQGWYHVDGYWRY